MEAVSPRNMQALRRLRGVDQQRIINVGDLSQDQIKPESHKRLRPIITITIFTCLALIYAAFFKGSYAYNSSRVASIEYWQKRSAENGNTTRLLVLHPGFGAPHFNQKLTILRRNIATLIGNDAPWDDISFLIFCYTVDADVPGNLQGQVAQHVTVNWVLQPGVIMHFLYNYVKPEYAAEYDYIMLMVDDVELQFRNGLNQPPMNWRIMTQLQQAAGIDIAACNLASNKMTHWRHMIQLEQYPNIVLREQSMVEWFCFLMRPEGYTKYYSIIDPNNPWSWGQDFITRYHGIRIGMVNGFIGSHNFAGAGAGKAVPGMVQYLQKYNTSYERESERVQVASQARLYFADEFPTVFPDVPNNVTARMKDPAFLFDLANLYELSGDSDNAILYWLDCINLAQKKKWSEGAYVCAINIGRQLEKLMEKAFPLEKRTSKTLSKWLSQKVPGEEIPNADLILNVYSKAETILAYRKEAPYHAARLYRTQKSDAPACFEAALRGAMSGPPTEKTFQSDAAIAGYYLDGELCGCGEKVDQDIARTEGKKACERLIESLQALQPAENSSIWNWLQDIKTLATQYKE